MRILGAIVLAHPAWMMTPLKIQDFHRRAIRRKFIRHDSFRMNACVAEQTPQQLQSRVLVASLLNQYIKHFALIIDRTP